MTSELTECESARLQIPASGAAAPDSPFWLLCRAASQLCAIPVRRVIETMRMLPVEQIAGAPPYVRGLCIVRGQPVPVVDTAALLFDDRSAPCERLVTIRAGERTIALATGAVLGVQAIAGASLDRLPPLLRDAAPDTIAAIATLDAELVLFLRMGRIIPEHVLAHIVAEGARA